jgi:flagellar basal-body rod modification protein FlgD
MTSPISSVANANAAAASTFNSLVSSSQAATQAAEQQMANNVANGVDASAASQVGGNFSTFLQILTTQLQNQDPTAPMDSNSFTQELVEFAGVEQQLDTNSLLQQLVTASGATGVKSLLGYIGQYVEVPSSNNQILIQNSQSEFSYTLPSAAQSAAITVTNSSNQQVASFSGPTASGVNNVAWNGEDNDGNQLPDGVYTISIAAIDSSNNPLTATNVQLIGQVTGVQTADSSGNDLQLGPNLTINDSNIDAVYSAGSMPQASTANSNSPSS